MQMRVLITLFTLLLFSVVAVAQVEPPKLESVPDGVPMPPPLSDETLEPEVTIIQRQEQTVEEYRINGQLYMVKVTPRKGFAYYLLDTDGDGDLDSRQDELSPRLMVPHWVIMRW